jgi:hypothetical protein
MPTVAREYPQFRAPQADNSALIAPGWRASLALAADNHAQLIGGARQLYGHDLATLAASARTRLFAAAADYTSQYSNVDAPPQIPAPESQLLFVSGHQPELFHPGVWLKNFALAELVRHTGGVGVHLLVDSDLCRSPGVRAITGSIDEPRLTTIPYDLALAPQPYEERRVQDEPLFQSFPRELAKTIPPMAGDPLGVTIWPIAAADVARHGNLGRALSAARHQFERQLGSDTLELPASAVAEFPEFRILFAALCNDLPRLHESYNGALVDYRTAHHLRNRAQPVPNLTRHDEWYEAPFWVWSADDPNRRPLFAQRGGTGWRLTDCASRTWNWSPGAHEGFATPIGPPGVKVRPRALITTLCARLLLADLFLHGIGGAKYDQVTDAFAENLLGFAPPPHMTLSATLRLPLHASGEAATGANSVPQQLQRLRDLRYHPERFVSGATCADWVSRKEAAIALEKSPANAAERHRQISAANEALSGCLAPQQQTTLEQLAHARQDADRQSLLQSREFSLALYPTQDLPRRLLDLVRATA